jgi:hypothetical protein
MALSVALHRAAVRNEGQPQAHQAPADGSVQGEPTPRASLAPRPKQHSSRLTIRSNSSSMTRRRNSPESSRQGLKSVGNKQQRRIPTAGVATEGSAREVTIQPLTLAAQSMVYEVVEEMRQGHSVVACGCPPSPTRAMVCLVAAIERVSRGGGGSCS